jgi:hypothetical protein
VFLFQAPRKTVEGIKLNYTKMQMALSRGVLNKRVAAALKSGTRADPLYKF